MKVIDLLNKIANNEEVPKKFIYVDKENVRYIFDIEVDKDYWCEELGNWFFDNFSIQTILNDEIEIIEEDKEIKELGYFNLCKSNEDREDLQLTYTGVADTFNDVYEKTNELVKAVNELKKGK